MDIQAILRNRCVQTAAISVATFVGGGALGYILGKKKSKVWTYLPRPKTDMSEVQSVVTTVTETTTEIIVEVDPEEKKIEHHIPTMEEVDSLKNGETIETILESSQRVKVITNNDSLWDYEIEMSTREKDIPYILHADEFINDEMGFHQETLTYYAGDDIMADTDDTPIYNYQGLMGELRFGHGSGDPGVVYIRNEKIHMEWEILLHQGTFSQEVLGLEMEKEAEDELHHSVLKFRQE